MNVFKTDDLSFYQKLFYILFSLIALGYLAILAKEVLCPLVFSIIFSIVLLPLANFMENKFRFSRKVASGVTLLMFVSSLSLLFYLIGSQISNLADNWPQFQLQLNLSVQKLQHWITGTYGINAGRQLAYLHNVTTKIMASGTAVVGSTFQSISSVLLFLVFTIIDIFFILLYRSLILNFLIAVFKKEDSDVVHAIVEQVQMIIRKYVIGILLEMFIVATIVCLAFLILGIKYAVLLGLITGLFNIIPYIGILTALVISILITFATAVTGTKVLLVILVLVLMHLIDSNILLPVIVGSKVKINALITVLGVVTGEMLWGIPGMFLSIPVIAVLKIIFDRIESLQPWGMLLGEENKNDPKTVAHDEESGETKIIIQ